MYNYPKDLIRKTFISLGFKFRTFKILIFVDIGSVNVSTIRTTEDTQK